MILLTDLNGKPGLKNMFSNGRNVSDIGSGFTCFIFN